MEMKIGSLRIGRFGLDLIQFIWFFGKPVFHWWAFPPDFREMPVFKGKPILWRLAIGWCEIRIFPTRSGNETES